MPKNEAGFAGYYLQTRVLRILFVWIGPALLLCAAAVVAGFLHPPVWVSIPLLAILLGLAIVRGRLEAVVENKLYSWSIGRDAEWEVRDALAAHLDDRFYLLNDVELPGRSGNIDHVVVGPSGIYTIETKGDIGDVDAMDDKLRIRGYSKDRYIRICRARQEALRGFLKKRLPGESRTYPVYAVIVFTRASVVKSRGATGGVFVESIPGLLRLLDKYASSNRLDELHRAQVFHAIAPHVASAGRSRIVEAISK